MIMKQEVETAVDKILSKFKNRLEVKNIGMKCDLYTILCKWFINKRKIQSLQLNKNIKKKLVDLKIKFKNYKQISFKYNLNSKQKKHYINNINLLTKKDILKKLVYHVLYKKINIKNNNDKALFILKFINLVKLRVKI